MKKLKLRDGVLMVCAAMALVLVYFFSSGFFEIQSTFADVVSMSAKQTIAEGEHWEFCVPEKNGRGPYFAYKGKLDQSPHVIGVRSVGNAESDEVITNDDIVYNTGIYVVGKLFYTTGDSDAIHQADIVKGVYDDKHFFVGSQRWVLSEYSDLKVVKADFKIEWHDYNEIYTETISSKDLTEEETLQANQWITDKFVPEEIQLEEMRADAADDVL